MLVQNIRLDKWRVISVDIPETLLKNNEQAKVITWPLQDSVCAKCLALRATLKSISVGFSTSSGRFDDNYPE